MSDALTYSEARNAMFKHVNIKRKGDIAELLGYVPEVIWPGEISENPDNDRIYFRVSLQPSESKRINHRRLKDSATDVHKEIGILCIEIFAPRSKGNKDSYNKMETAKELFKNVFRSNRILKSLWFRYAVWTPLDPSINSFRSKLIVNYSYLEKQT